MTIDQQIVRIIEDAGVDIVCSVPCNLLDTVLQLLDSGPVRHVPVTREEEGVGILAGAALAGKRPLLLMQNSGLGNCVNALASLTSLYKLPLFLLMSHRGGAGERIIAQKPMGAAAPAVLDVLNIAHLDIAKTTDLEQLAALMRSAYEESCMRAALLQPELWS